MPIERSDIERLRAEISNLTTIVNEMRRELKELSDKMDSNGQRKEDNTEVR